MTYRNLMVHLGLNTDNDGVLKVAGELAGRFKAHVIGIAACQPLPPVYEEGLMTATVITEDQAEIAKEIKAAETKFRAALEGRAASLEWRSTVTYAQLADYVADEARAADLVVTGRDAGAALFDNTRRVSVGDLAMRAGRPVLVVPDGLSTLALRNVFIGWKETREARRAAADALPLLQAAAHVTVVEIAGEETLRQAEAHVQDVAAWLARHQVEARPLAVPSKGIDAAGLIGALREGECDLLVAGAYGHNRLREWVFGGITRDILLNPDFCVLISH